MLTDTHGRQFPYLRLSLLDNCNFKCQYCLPDGYQGGKASYLTTREISHIVNAFATLGTSKIRLTGGEPSMRKDLTHIIQLTRNTPGIETVALTTNGYRLEKEFQNWHQAGLNHLNVSVDSLDPAAFKLITGSEKLSSIVNGIEKAAAIIDKVKVNVVLMKSQQANVLPAFLNWIKDLPIEVRFIELMQTGDNINFFKKEHQRAQTSIDMLTSDGWKLQAKGFTDGPAQIYSHPNYAGKIGFITPYADSFCQSCNRLRVSSTGKLHLCLFTEQGIDLRHLLQHPDQQPELINTLTKLMGKKVAAHQLHDNITGVTQHLASIGG